MAWCVWGIVLMSAGVPHLTAGERLARLPMFEPLVRPGSRRPTRPAELPAPPFRLRISMHGDRPVYRFNTGRVFGRWTLIYADTGEPVEPLDQDAALEWLRGYRSGSRGCASLRRLSRTARQLHSGCRRCRRTSRCTALRWTMAGGTEYYVSERSGEAVMKSDRWTRLLGFSGYITHTFFFFRQQTWWSTLPAVVVVDRTPHVRDWRGRPACGAMASRRASVTNAGPVAFAVHRLDEVAPLRGIDRFGVLTITWVFSGLVSLDVIPGIRETRVLRGRRSPGRRSIQGEGALRSISSRCRWRSGGCAPRRRPPGAGRSRRKSSSCCSSAASRT